MDFDAQDAGSDPERDDDDETDPNACPHEPALLHGAALIEEVRKTKPHVYLQVVASLLPRQVQMEKLSPLGDISDEELQMMEELLTASRAKLVQKIKPHNGKGEPLDVVAEPEK